LRTSHRETHDLTGPSAFRGNAAKVTQLNSKLPQAATKVGATNRFDLAGALGLPHLHSKYPIAGLATTRRPNLAGPDSYVCGIDILSAAPLTEIIARSLMFDERVHASDTVHLSVIYWTVVFVYH
jgi:hypothetical protein